jgi:hypothetical protein
VLISLFTFFEAEKNVTAAPHRGNANKPITKRDPAKKKAPQEIKPTTLQRCPTQKNLT